METLKTFYKTPIGFAEICGDKLGISSIRLIDEIIETNLEIPRELQNCVLQLNEYFEGKRTQFDLQLNPQGTEFQKKVWESLQTIPFGKTTSYLQQSKNLGNQKAIRAVASANGKNPLWIVIPCHRIIGSDGSLTGYAGGLWRKKWLLDHENANKQQVLF